jgi:serine/threonine-protein kinase HipA
VQTEFGDYTLSKAYDMMCTVLHTPTESDTALDLYKGDIKSGFYQQFGYFRRPNFEELAKRFELVPARSTEIIDALVAKKDEVLTMIEYSFPENAAKEKYAHHYNDKLKRFK